MWACSFHRILSVCSSRLGINTANDEEPLQLATSSSSPGDISQVLSRNASWTLLDLPLEIKTKIYEYAFEQAQLEIKSTTEPGVGSRATYCHGSRAVTMVSKQVRWEAQPVFIARTPVLIRDLRGLTNFLSKGGSQWASVIAGVSALELRLVPQSERWLKLRRGPSLECFLGLRFLLIEWTSKPQIVRKITFDQEPPRLQVEAARRGDTIVGMAEKMMVGGLGELNTIVATLKVPEHVRIRWVVKMYSTELSRSPVIGVSAQISVANRALLSLTAMSRQERCLRTLLRYITDWAEI